MLNLKVSRECDEEVHDLPESFGLESHVERLETLLTSEGSDAAPRYVGVWGMGGVGKTLLLQRLDGSPKVRRHFQGAMFIWLTVGQTPDIMALYRTLSKKLHLEPELYENPEDFKRYLHTEFIQRRVFLVLDDVWQDKAFDSLSLAKGKGSVTLLSTRNKSLLERPTPPITQKQMDRLSKEDSWSLFCVHAFGQPSNVPCELRDLAQDIAEECQGNPLALKVIGKAMFRMALCEWAPLLKKLRESRMSEASVQLELYQRLKPCYDVLSDDDRRLKDCFLYFAAYPEDFRIDFHEMLYYWIGEAWVPGDCADDPRLDAFSLLRKLWKRSLIESDQCYLLDEGNVLGEDLSFNIHDVMRDLAFHILGNDRGTPPARQLYFYRAGRNLEEFPREWEEVSEALRVSLMSNKLTNLPQRFYAPKLVSLLLGGNSIRSVPTSFLSNLRELKVLDLSHGQFDSLPDKLGDLENLVCLDLSYCKKLKNLPETVGKLHVLKCLLLHGCWELKYLPSVVANLTSLQVLHVVANLTSLQVLQTIDSQRLTWSEHRPSGMPRAESLCHADPIIRASLEDICRLVVLTQLSICGRNNRGLVLPDQMPNCFKQLQDLDLWEFEDLDIPSSFTRPGAFPALAQLRIDARKLVEFPDVQKGALPKLRKLDLHGCISLERLPSLEFLPSLEQYYF
jgi:disease resistance protein RPS2